MRRILTTNRVILAHAAVLAVLVGVAATTALHAQSSNGLPRFASLGSDKVNMRAGPGKRYPVNWTYVRQGLPMKIVGEHQDWRRVQDADGTVGWVHRALLSVRRTAVVTGAVRPLFADPDPTSLPVLLAEPNVLGRVLACRGGWCQMRIKDREGWIRRVHVFGVLDAEDFD
jgi:SH3-like domain-containing protein